MKAQLSVEFLLLLLLSFSLISLSLYFLSQLAEASSIMGKRAMFLRESLFLKEVILEVCYFGDGEKRTIELPLALTLHGNKEITISLSNSSLTFYSPCVVSSPYVLEGEVVVENEQGVVVIS